MLEEQFAIAVPGSVALLGVTAGDGGQLVAWSRREAFSISATKAPEPFPVRFSGAPAGAGFAADGTLELVDPAAGVLRRVTMAGERASRLLPPGLRIVDAVRTARHGWIVAGVDADGQYRIQPLDAGPWWVIRADTLRGGVLAPYRLAATAQGVLLTEAEPPFRTWRVGPEGTGQAFAPKGSGTPESTGVQKWVSTPVVDLGNAMVQTLSDLASDRRVMVLYDHHGREQRKTVLSVPMALVGISADGRHLIGVRDLGRPEVVLYAWHWSSSHDKGAEP